MIPPSEIRKMVLALHLGLCGPCEAIAWADSWIMKLQQPPHWLIETSMGSGLHRQEMANLILQGSPAPRPSEHELLAAMAVRLIDRREDLTAITGLLMEELCWSENPAKGAVGDLVYLIDHELEWNPEGAGRRAREFIGTHLEEGRRWLLRLSRSHPAA